MKSFFFWAKRNRDAGYLFFSATLLIGLCCSKPVMSSSFIGYVLWFISFGDYQAFKVRLIENRHWILPLVLLMILHALSLIWSDDLVLGTKGLKVRISAFILPLLIAGTFPFSRENLLRLGNLLLLALTTVMLINWIHFGYLLQQGTFEDIRQLSWLDSHIRFGILTAFSLAISRYLISQQPKYRYGYWGYMLFTTAFLVYSQALSSFFCLLLVILFALIELRIYSKMNPWIQSIIFLPFVIGIIAVVFDLSKPLESCPPMKNKAKAALLWNQRSKVKFDRLDAKSQPISSTCERYLCSKYGSSNDFGIGELTDEDIRNIELGFTDPQEANGGFMHKYNALKYQLHETKNPNGNSLLQRIIYWQVSLKTIKQEPLLSVGIGDIDAELYKNFKATSLLEKNYKRSHNMYLTSWLACGILAPLLLIYLGLYLLYLGIKHRFTLLALFSVLILCTMFYEDSIETQSGATFFGLFIALLASKKAIAAWNLKIA